MPFMSNTESNPNIDWDEVIAATSGLSKQYGRGQAAAKALNGVDLMFSRGRMTAIVGASGSGKSTLLNCMAGFDKSTSGTSWIDGLKIQGMRKKDRTVFRRRVIGVIFQEHGLIPVLTCRENMLLSLSLDDRKPDKHELDGIVEKLGLGDRLEHMPSELSGGQKQKTAVARVLLQKPSLVLADEPTGSLDVDSSREVMSIFRSMVDDFGISVIIVTHSVEAAAAADRAIVLSDGRVVTSMDNPNIDSIGREMRMVTAEHDENQDDGDGQ